MGRTHIVLDDKLLARAMRVTGVRTKRQAVDEALRALVRQREAYARLRGMRGRVKWEGDPEVLRRNRV
jgi:Arc/MetJ family transcription regulator